MRRVFLSSLVPEEMTSTLRLHAKDIEIVRLPPDPMLEAPEAYHPDMIMSCFDGKIFAHADYIFSGALHEAMSCGGALGKVALNEVTLRGGTSSGAALPQGGFEVVSCHSARGKKYPESVAFNALVADDFAVLSRKSVDPTVLASLCGRRVIDVSQGYASCSVLYDGVGCVTSDKGIAMALEKCGIEVLLIRPGHITLEPFDYGFIGGASFLLDDTVFTFGDISSHPDADLIASFITGHSKKLIPLSHSPLFDYGGAHVM